MNDYLAFVGVAAIAAALAASTTPAFARFARRVGLVVHPRNDRWHRAPKPLLGGAAIALGALVLMSLAPGSAQKVGVITLCGGLAFALGLLDDFRHFAPTTKLVGQVMIGSVLALGGIHVEIVEFAPLAFLITVFWVVIMMNALNLLDNMDGLAAGVTMISAALLGLTSLPESPLASFAAAATAGASLGFLVHNFSPARAFMGDAGSLLLGFMLAVVALLHTASGAANLGLAVFGPLVVLALPIFDTTLVALSRRSAGRPVHQGGRDHASHRLAALGLSDRSAVLFLYTITVVLGITGLLLDSVSTLVAPAVALAFVGLVLFGVFLADVDVYGQRGAAREARAQPFRRALSAYGRFGAEVALDLVLVVTAYYLAYLIRFEGVPQNAWIRNFSESVPIVAVAQLAALVVLGVYRTLWRYLAVTDAVAILRAVTIGSGVAVLAIVVLFRFESYSRAVFLLDWLIVSVLIIGARALLLWLRHWFELRPRSGSQRVLIVGANDNGAFALGLLRAARETSYTVVGFVDDDPGKRHRHVRGLPVVATIEELSSAIERLRADMVVIAGGSDDLRRRIHETCATLAVEVRDFRVPV